jgi:hypothetical protein
LDIKLFCSIISGALVSGFQSTKISTHYLVCCLGDGGNVVSKFMSSSRMFRATVLSLFTAVQGYNYDWDRLHRCDTVQLLRETIDDYRENFPCLDCREHFQSLLDMHPFPLNLVRTPEDVKAWTWLTHNLVNVRLNKTWESFDVMDECH